MRYTAFIILSIFIFCIHLGSFSQKNPKQPTPMNQTNNTNTSFIFDRYRIDPTKKEVSVRTYWEKDEMVEGYPIHSFGQQWDVDPAINFDSTALYIHDYYIAFKEYYVKPNETSQSSQGLPLAGDGYEYINTLYRKDGKYYYYISESNKHEIVIPIDVDFPNLIPMVYGKYGIHGFYLYDNKGLYFMREYPTSSIKKIASGTDKVPVMHTNYCEYDGKVYQNEDMVGTLDQLTIFDVSGDGDMLYVTDGKQILCTAYIQDNKPFVGMNKWIQITRKSPIVVDDGKVYIPSLKKDEQEHFQLLFHTPTGFVAQSSYLKEAPIPLQEIQILHEGAYELLDINQYQLHRHGFYTYKGKLYRDGILIENDFDAPQIRAIEGVQECFSDGKQLGYKYAVEKNGGRIKYNTVPIADINNLYVVHSGLLTDGINFYEIRNSKIEVIPLSKFPFEVVIQLSRRAYFGGDPSILKEQIQTIYTPG